MSTKSKFLSDDFFRVCAFIGLVLFFSGGALLTFCEAQVLTALPTEVTEGMPLVRRVSGLVLFAGAALLMFTRWGSIWYHRRYGHDPGPSRFAAFR